MSCFYQSNGSGLLIILPVASRSLLIGLGLKLIGLCFFPVLRSQSELIEGHSIVRHEDSREIRNDTVRGERENHVRRLWRGGNNRQSSPKDVMGRQKDGQRRYEWVAQGRNMDEKWDRGKDCMESTRIRSIMKHEDERCRSEVARVSERWHRHRKGEKSSEHVSSALLQISTKARSQRPKVSIGEGSGSVERWGRG